MANKTVIIPEIGEVTLIKRRGSRNLRLSFTRTGGIRVSMPSWVPFQSGIDFARSKKEWISKHQPTHDSTLGNGDRIGKAHRLVIEQRPSDSVRNPRVSIRQNTVTVSCPVDMPVTHDKVQKAAERGALKALKREADQLLPQRLSALALKHGFDYKSVSTKRLSSRWGSCSQAKDIILNTYLMQLPWELIDYVIVHELVHTEHLNHGPGFWERFERVLPDARSRRKLLKTHKTAITPAR